jgi:glycosyltransferase involved in cell wall biosynthesis
MSKPAICLVSSLHLCYNPRLLKEADALHEAGSSERVVAMRVDPAKAEWDKRLLSSRDWRLDVVDACHDNLAGRFTWFKSALRQRFHQRSGWLRQQRSGSEMAFNRYFPEMCRLVAHERADLFIAHNLQALPVAAFAARRWHARLGFDAEDFHRGEISEKDADRAPLRELIMAIEQKHIPNCDYLTAASDGIGDAYATTLGVSKPVTILNAFPLSERQGHTPNEELQRERQGPGLSLYWYSQVIGADRGLKDVLQALALLPPEVSLHLRGVWAGGFESVFRKQAEELRVIDRVFILPPAPPDQLVERAAQHDVGLALEAGETENRRIAVTNKILNYFLAGLAIVATNVPGQRAILESAPEAGFLFRPGDAESLAANLSEWLRHPAKLRLARGRSKYYGESRFCWEAEKGKLFAGVESALLKHSKWQQSWHRQVSE